MTAHVNTVVTDLRASLERLYGERLRRLVLFGSQARGEAKLDSDIDVLVVLRGPVDTGEEIARTGGILSELCLRHDVVVSCLYMDADEYESRQGPLLRNIRREGVGV